MFSLGPSLPASVLTEILSAFSQHSREPGPGRQASRQAGRAKVRGPAGQGAWRAFV